MAQTRWPTDSTLADNSLPSPTSFDRPNDRNPRDLDIEIDYKLDGKHCEVQRTQSYRMR